MKIFNENLWCNFSNFLPIAELETVRKNILDQSASFSSSKTVSDHSTHRRSQVLFELPKLTLKLFEKSLLAIWPSVLSSLGYEFFSMDETTTQATLHTDGDFYKVHIDNGKETLKRRTISFAYYLHEEPRSFTGGELVLYQKDQPNKVFEPIGNSIVFFPSNALHEVLPILGGQGFTEGRLALNGWVSRSERYIPL